MCISTLPGQRGNPDAEALGQSCSGFTTKIRFRCERGGELMVLVVLVLTAAQRHQRDNLVASRVAAGVYK